MAALIPWLSFVALESITLIPRLAFIAQRTVGGWCNPLFQHFDFNRDFLDFHIVASCFFLIRQNQHAPERAVRLSDGERKLISNVKPSPPVTKTLADPFRSRPSSVITTPAGLAQKD